MATNGWVERLDGAEALQGEAGPPKVLEPYVLVVRVLYPELVEEAPGVLLARAVVPLPRCSRLDDGMLRPADGGRE